MNRTAAEALATAERCSAEAETKAAPQDLPYVLALTAIAEAIRGLANVIEGKE